MEDKLKNDDVLVYDLADVGTRFVALIIDSIILGVIAGVLSGIGGGVWAGSIGTFIIGVAYNWYFWTQRSGQTPGKMAMNIRVVKADGTPLTASDAVLRYIGYYINSVVLMIGWIWALLDKDRRGWHDIIASTYVVRA